MSALRPNPHFTAVWKWLEKHYPELAGEWRDMWGKSDLALARWLQKHFPWEHIWNYVPRHLLPGRLEEWRKENDQ